MKREESRFKNKYEAIAVVKIPEKVEDSTIVTGGQVSGGPPLGPQLGPLGVNISAVVAEINKVTANFQGSKVPVKIIVDTETKKFEIQVGLPPTSALLFKAAGIEKGSSNGIKQPAGNVTFKDIIEIAKTKYAATKRGSLKAIVLQVLGTCVSVGITVDSKNPKDVILMIKEGKLNVPEGGEA
ncbi:MAG: 50S ribosomal protein L11 [Thermoproteota archaeon]